MDANQVQTLAGAPVGIPSVEASANPMFAAFKADSKLSFVRPYDPSSVIVAGFRHSVMRWRDVKGQVAKQAKMATVPAIILPDTFTLPEKAKQVLIGCLEDAQDAIIRLAVELGASTIAWQDVTLDATLEHLTAARVSTRLTKEQITGWGNIALIPACNQRADQISEAKGYNEEQRKAQRASTLNAYVAHFSKLAAAVPNVGQSEAQAMQNMLAIAKLDDDMAKVLSKKLHAMLNPVEADVNL